ncbi:MAG: HPr family phosphocarrier protein [Rhodospirillales bacterium]|nr:HPr family phosphocarrier protein [Rhodospirillales bacterium]MDP7625494.1 HPr family phosphocarrier protein [Rhodospirillales bacterium]
MSEATLTICNERGLHARAAARFVKLASEFDAEVLVTKDGQEVSGLSIMGLMMLAAAPGDKIAVRTSGKDEKYVLKAIEKLVKNKFEES